MTRDELVARLDAMNSYNDHCEADDLLIEYLLQTGERTVAEAYNRLIARAGNWWYS